jgi:hypothetical protein
MGSVDYTIERHSCSADFEYQNPDDSACARFYDTIKKQENCTFAQLFFGVGSTKKYVGETICRKHLRQFLIARPQPQPAIHKKASAPKKTGVEFIVKKKEAAAKKTNSIIIERANKLRDAFYNCESFSRHQAQDVVGMERNSLLTLLQFMRGQGVLEMTKIRRGAKYRFVKQV